MDEIVRHALVAPVVNLGQLSKDEIKQLDRAVRHGTLAKAKAGNYPIRKTVWAAPDYDFEYERENALRHLRMMARLDAMQAG